MHSYENNYTTLLNFRMISTKKKHIIMADDDADVTDMFRDMADDQCPDLKITLAVNGMQTLELLKLIPSPDAIILDINMPLMNGKDCLSKIRSNPAYDGIPIIMLSSGNNDKEIKSCLSAGANFYFTKPSSYFELKYIVNSVCRGDFEYAA